MSKTAYTLLSGFFCFYLTATAQHDHINFTAITSRDGLVSNSVNAILQDHQGLMWFATDDGLNKFDGTNFTAYRNRWGDTTSLKANEILALHEDKKGNLWIGTSGGGFSLYDRHKDAFINYPLHGVEAGLSHSAVIRSICSDYLGNIWIAQFEAVYVLDTKTNRISKITFPPDTDDGPPKTALFCVFEDSRHRIWVGADNGLYLYTRATNSIKLFASHRPKGPRLPANKVRCITEDRVGNIWVGTEEGLCRLQPDERSFVTYQHEPGNKFSLSNNTINCIRANDDGVLWIGTSDGLNIFDPKQAVFTIYKPDPAGNIHSLTSKTIRCAYKDKQGIYWFGTFRGGINKYDKNINLFNLQPGSTFPVNSSTGVIVSAFAEKNNDHLFVGTESGLFEFNRHTKKIQPVKVPFNPGSAPPPAVLYLHKSRDNKLYIGTFAQGVFIKDLTTGSWQQLTEGPGKGNLNSNDIFCISEDSKGNIWIGSNGQGINLLHANKTITRYTPHPSPGNPNEKLLPFNGYIRAIAEDADGNIWIGSHGGGVAVFHPADDKWTIYTQDNSQLASDKIQSILCDSQGNIWIGTYGEGLCLYDKNKNQFVTFSEKDGLQNTTIYQIVEDLQGRIWLTSNAGISCFDKKKNFRNFSGHNGVLNNNFVHGAGIRLQNGELFFGGQEGFNYFNPADLTINNNVPTVLLTDLKVSNKSVVPGSESPIKEPISIANEIRLGYKQNFALSFVALNYSIPKQNNYAYKLEGFDKDWTYTGTLNTASYTNLDPGEYTFHVKASNNDGIWSKEETLLKIFVRPPFWRTTYAYMLYALAIGGLLLYIRYRGISKLRRKFALEQEREQTRRMRELDRLKLKFLTNLSHDFRTPISLIMGPVDQLIKEESIEGKIDKLHMIRRNARRLLNLVNQLLDFRKMEEHELRLQLSTGDFISFVKEVTESFRDFSERKHIHFAFTSDIPGLEALFDHDKIERVLFNLLSNAFKFTLEGGSVAVEIHRYNHETDKENNWITLQVTDNGIGIPADKKEKIFERFFQTNSPSAILNQGTGIGLSITREFIKMHGGKIEVESEPGNGCVFTIHLPLKPSATVAAPGIPDEATETAPFSETETSALPETAAAIDENNEETISILLVEDNDDFRFYLKDNLRNNYKVLEAVNGKEGWQKALALHPQLIVSDISMPEMDGIALVKKLKSDKRTSHIPVILLTALTGEEQQLRGLKTGANDYITKPFNFEVLHAKIESLLHLQSTFKNTYTKQIRMISPEPVIESADERLLQDILLFLENNLNNPQLSVEGLSKQIGMSRSTLYNKMLQLTGETPVAYIRSFRLNKAAVFMQKSNMTIAEIAYQVGFTTPNYFARAFKTKFNMLPSEYIAKFRTTSNNNS
jgi:signal transduction histidine kinase/ligand-binding sensor domain-containing protein/DNA-binding response OmpR family regulator